jgi:hypothetical protein
VEVTIGAEEDSCYFSHFFNAKAKSYQKKKEVNVYEEISGVICSHNVSRGFYVDWL